MAPEQLTGKPVDPRVDQYALAAIVYEMLSGRMPFSVEGSVTEQAMRVLHAEPEPLEGVSPALAEVLKRGMAKDVDRRFPSVSAFVDALMSGAQDAASGELAPLPGEATSISSPLDLAPLAQPAPVARPPSIPALAAEPPTTETPKPPIHEVKTMELSATNLAPEVGRDTDPHGAGSFNPPPVPPINERVTAPSMKAVTPDHFTDVVEVPHRTLGPGETTLRPQRRLTVWLTVAALVVLAGVAATAIALAR
jgi:serine/threonine protein kinase